MVTRVELQRASVALFAARGYAAAGIRELGASLGINPATIYHHAGGGKPELLTSVMRECLDALLRGGRAAVAASTDPAGQLAHLAAAHVGLAAANPMTAIVTDQEVRSLDEASRAELVGLRDDYESLWAGVLARGARARSFDVTDQQLTRLALLEMCNGVAHWFRPDGRLSCAQVQARHVELAVRLVGADPSAVRGLDLPAPTRLDTEPT